MLIADFLRAQAGWRLAHRSADPVPTACCAAALLDAAAFAATLPEDDRYLTALARGGCFRGNVFDPGPKGISIARWWQYGGAPRHDEVLQAGPRDLIAALAAAVSAGSAGAFR
jgi:hypothetical protein